MVTTYEERLKELFGELKPAHYYISEENLATDRPLTKSEAGDIFGTNKYFVYAKSNIERPYKRKIFVHMHSYYLPDSIRGMTDTVRHIWINAKEYFREHVLRHEKIHVAHPEWSESVVRQFHDSYEPSLPDVEFVRV